MKLYGQEQIKCIYCTLHTPATWHIESNTMTFSGDHTCKTVVDVIHTFGNISFPLMAANAHIFRKEFYSQLFGES